MPIINSEQEEAKSSWDEQTGVDTMEGQGLVKGVTVQFNLQGFRLGKIIRVRGRMLTVLLSPFKQRGRHQGKRKRIHMDDVKGIVYRKKVIPFPSCSKKRG